MALLVAYSDMKYSIILFTILIAKETTHAGLPQSPCHFKAYYLSDWFVSTHNFNRLANWQKYQVLRFPLLTENLLSNQFEFFSNSLMSIQFTKIANKWSANWKYQVSNVNQSVNGLILRLLTFSYGKWPYLKDTYL